MRIHLDCFPCFLRQSIIALRLGTEDESLQKAILVSTLENIRQADTSKPPAYTTTFIHRKIRQLLGKDPFKDIKSEYNQISLKMYPSLKAAVANSPDPLWTSVSKGQGNFETLTGTKKNIFFLFQSKCDVVSKELGLPTGSMLLRKS